MCAVGDIVYVTYGTQKVWVAEMAITSKLKVVFGRDQAYET